MGTNVQLEILQQEDGSLTVNVIYLDTGEIRQRRFTKQQFFQRLFIYNDWAKQGFNVESINLVRR